ncbi:hypothetical protein ACVWZR_010764, partial [Bradyrhizobium sp. i1.3.1]
LLMAEGVRFEHFFGLLRSRRRSERICHQIKEKDLMSRYEKSETCKLMTERICHYLKEKDLIGEKAKKRQGRTYELLCNDMRRWRIGREGGRLAIYHASMKPVSRASGRSAVASAAYRAGERLTNERDGITHDFTRKEGVEHAEIVLPEGVNAEWARSRAKLWNAAEFAESRKDARVARELEIALPHELTAEQRLALTREFAQDLANRYGAAVDFAIHKPHEASDVRNHHAHLLMTTRQVTGEGLGEKTYIERENKWLLSNDLPTSRTQLRGIRQSWEIHANQHLAMAGLDIRIDHRSHQERGLELEPTEHMGVHATQMQRRGLEVSRSRLDEGAARRNAELIREKPEQVLTIVTNEKSVFDRHDIARTLHRYINNDAQAFQNAFATVMASPAVVELLGERTNPETGEIELARYSTREMVEIESGMVKSAERMAEAHSHGVDRRHVERAIGAQDAAIQRSAGDATARLSDEQRRAIEHITGPERIAAVIELRPDRESTHEPTPTERQLWRPSIEAEKGGEDSGRVSRTEDLAQDRGGDRQQRQHRNPFEGLGRGAAAEGPQQDRAEPAQERPERAETQAVRRHGRGMFDGLKLNVDRGAASAAQEQPERGRLRDAQERQSEGLGRPSDMERAIDRYARAYDGAERNHREGLPILEAQKQELRQAGQQLDQARPGATALMVSVLQHDPETRQAMRELSARERVRQLSAGMERERAALADPNVRAERFVQRWQELQGERQQLRGWRDDGARQQIDGQMHGMAKSLERDPQVESVLRNRSHDLGITHIRQDQNLSRAMEQQLTQSRRQSLGLER